LEKLKDNLVGDQKLKVRLSLWSIKTGVKRKFQFKITLRIRSFFICQDLPRTL